jgi:tripartite-type tricarboxylate transporter receptor subunit TctC
MSVYDRADETFTSEIAAIGSWRCRASSRLADRAGAILSVAANPAGCSLSARWRVDPLGRPIADKLKALLGTTVVENISGGGGPLGASAVAHAAADGYTILLGGTRACLHTVFGAGFTLI